MSGSNQLARRLLKRMLRGRGNKTTRKELVRALAQLEGRQLLRGKPPSPRSLAVLRELDSATRLSGGVPPTVAELSKSLDRSPATVFEHLIALVNRGLVRRTGSDRARNHVVAPAGRKFLDNTRISHHCPGVCSTETEDATTTNTGMTT